MRTHTVRPWVRGFVGSWVRGYVLYLLQTYLQYYTLQVLTYVRACSPASHTNPSDLTFLLRLPYPFSLAHPLVFVPFSSRTKMKITRAHLS